MDIKAYTERGRAVIQAAQNAAVTRDHQQLTPLHITAALLSEDEALPKHMLGLAGAVM